MKILFGYINSTRSFDMPMGIAYLSGMLKTGGYETGLLDLTWNRNVDLSRLIEYDLLAISSTTLEYVDALKAAKEWKSLSDHPVIIGGCKPTIEPEATVEDPAVDAERFIWYPTGPR